MPSALNLFALPAPHGDPTTGFVDQQSGSQCGQCLCAPRYWKLTAVAPGTTAPTSLTQYITDFTGDGWVTTGFVSDSATTIQLGAPNYSTWLQFPATGIAPGATITSATLSLKCAAGNVGNLPWILYGSPSASQSEPTAANYATLPRTAAATTGTIVNPTTGTTYTFDATSIVQELVKGSYWTNPGSIMLFLQDNGSAIAASFNALDSNANLPFLSTSLAITVAGTGPDPTVQQFLGDFVLQRELEQFTTQRSPNGPCAWYSPVRTTAGGAGGYWALYFVVLTNLVTGPSTQWYVTANIAPFPVNDLNVYDFHSLPPNTLFNCLGPNTFYLDADGYGIAYPNFPASVYLEPFWP